MSSLAVARKDFRDSIRSRWLWALSALFVLFAAGIAALYAFVFATPEAQEELTALGFLIFLMIPTGTMVPIIGMMVGYKAIVGERESGSLKLLLGLPHTRLDVVVGKLAGRVGVVLLSLVIGFVAALAVVIALYAEFDLVAFLLFVLATGVFAAAYVSIGVGISSLTASTSKALALAVGFIAIAEFLWGSVLIVLAYLSATIQGESFSLAAYSTNQPEWAGFLSSIMPSAGYSNLVIGLLPTDPRQSMGGLGGAGPEQAGAAAEAAQPFYQTEWFGLLVLLVWFVGPLALGYARFKNADL